MPLTSDQCVEAAAQAIHHTFANRIGRARPWAKLMPKLRDHYRAEARAALAAAQAVSRESGKTGA